MFTENRENDVFCVDGKFVFVADTLGMSRFTRAGEMTNYLQNKALSSFVASKETYASGYVFADGETADKMRSMLASVFNLTEIPTETFKARYIPGSPTA